MSWTAPQGRSIVKGFVWIVTGGGEHLGDIWGLTYQKKGVKINVEEAQWSEEEFSMIGIRNRKSESWKLEKKIWLLERIWLLSAFLRIWINANMKELMWKKIDQKPVYSLEKYSFTRRQIFISKSIGTFPHKFILYA